MRIPLVTHKQWKTRSQVNGMKQCLRRWIHFRIIGLRNVGNPGLLCSHVLDPIKCMHLSLGLSRSNTIENNGFKNHYKINICKKSAHTWIWMFPDQFLTVKNMPEKIGESLLMHYPRYASCAHDLCTSIVIPMHAAYAHPMLFSCMRPVWFQCTSYSPKMFCPITLPYV